MRTRTALIGAALAAIALVGLTACGGGEMGGEMAPEAGKPTTDTVVNEPDRQVIRNADLTIRVDDVRESVGDVNAIATSAGGRTSQQSVTAEGEAVYASLTLRVPADALDDVLARLGALGDVQSVNITTEDVTTQVVDLDARIEALQTSVDRLEALMSQATSAQDLVEIERELSARQAELDSLTAQRAALADAVALSTVTVWLSPSSEAAEFTPPGFLSGLESGWNALKTVVATIITALGFVLPFLVLILAIAAPVAIVIFLVGRRRRR